MASRFDKAASDRRTLTALAIGLLLLGFAAPASAEPIPEATAPEAIVSTPAASVPEPAASETEAVPVPVEEASAAVESTVTAVVTEAPVELPDAGVSSPEPVDTTSASPKPIEATAAAVVTRAEQTADHAIGRVAATSQDLSEASPAKRLAEVAEVATSGVRKLSAQAIHDLGGSSPLGVEGLLPKANSGPTSAVTAPPASGPLPGPGESTRLTVAGRSLTGDSETSFLADPLTSYLSGSGGAEPSALGAIGGPQQTELIPAAAVPAAGQDSFGGTDRRGDRAPSDAPAQPPGSSQTATGSPGSSFIPFAALLALLALVAPATRHRRKEAADIRAPAFFVCALERPG